MVGGGISTDTTNNWQAFLAQVGNGIGYRWLPFRTLLVAPLWCDQGRCSRTVVVIKLRRTSALTNSIGNLALISFKVLGSVVILCTKRNEKIPRSIVVSVY